MRSLGSFVGGVLIALGSLAGCGGSEAPPPEDPASVDVPPPRSDAPSDPAGAPKPSGNPAGAGAPGDFQRPSEIEQRPTDPVASPPLPPKTAEPAPPPPSAVEAVVEGTIASRKGTVLLLNTTGAGPASGSKWSLYRYFEQKVGPFNTTGWLGIADVTVKGEKAGRLELTIDAERSVIMVDGKKVDHFAAGNRVKLEPPK